MSNSNAMKIPNMPLLFGYHFHAYPAVLEIRHANHAPFGLTLRLLTLLNTQLMRNTNMPALRIQTSHLRTEKPTMRRAVLQLINHDIIMNHLVEDNILHHLLGQGYARVDTENEIEIMPLAAEQFALLAKADLAEKSLGIA